MNDISDHSAQSIQTTSVFALFLRLFWLLIGNAILVVCFLAILAKEAKGLSWADALYGITIPLIIAARFLDVTRFGGKNSVGQPATIADWKRSTAMLIGCGGAALLAAHAIAWIM
jgi:hypothetical protein